MTYYQRPPSQDALKYIIAMLTTMTKTMQSGRYPEHEVFDTLGEMGNHLTDLELLPAIFGCCMRMIVELAILKGKTVNEIISEYALELAEKGLI